MATATLSDFKVYEPEFQAGLWEGTTQNANAFNAASRGAIQLVNETLAGQYEKEALFKNIANIVTRRDPTSTSAATAVKPTQDEFISVKVDRKIGPIEFTLDALRKIGKDQREMSFVLGQQVGQAKTLDLLNTGIVAVEAAIEGQTAAVFDATGETVKTLTTGHLVSGLAKFGDQADRIIAWVMHSKPYFDLVGQQINAAITNVADRVIYGALPGTLNRPVVVCDAPALWNDLSTDTYNVLGLVEGGLVVKETEQSEIITDPVTGGENIMVRVQGEYAFNLGCKGFKWDVANGGANPTNSALGTTTNWDLVMASVKDIAGIRIVVQ